MTLPKILVNKKLMATFPCDACGNSYTKDVSQFIRHKTRVRLKYNCECGHAFNVMLERRQSVRKEVRLKGVLTQNNRSYPGMITDLSPTGLRFKTLEKSDIRGENTAEVSFVLDNEKRSEVRKLVRVQKVLSEYNVGCKFEDPDHDGDLGKYFLFYFLNKPNK